ncbi:MAG: hypothetical protein WCD35_03445 [Mycobacteriales bacterium]
MRARLALAAAVAALGAVGAVASAAGPTGDPAPGPAAYVNPPFARHCKVHRFGEGVAPDLNGYPDDPLCVEYQKRDITVDNGGAVRFALAEPARFAIALPKCKYWQQDHWRIQVDPQQEHVVQWDGSYWFDKSTGRAGAILRNFRIEGRPADPGAAADLVATVSPELAQAMRSHGASASFGVPFDPRCGH